MAASLINILDFVPPLTNTASSRSKALIFVPLAAKQASPLFATGRFARGISLHVLPPSKVLSIKNLPSIGSPIIIPLCSFQNSMASKNIPLVLFSYTTFQLSPPSLVFKIYPGESTAIITAVAASNASMSRNSFFSKPFTVIHFQFFPALVVLPTVPLLPLTQTTLSFTTLKPRKLVLVPEVSISIAGKCLCAFSDVTVRNEKEKENKIRVLKGLIILLLIRDKMIIHNLPSFF